MSGHAKVHVRMKYIANQAGSLLPGEVVYNPSCTVHSHHCNKRYRVHSNLTPLTRTRPAPLQERGPKLRCEYKVHANKCGSVTCGTATSLHPIVNVFPTCRLNSQTTRAPRSHLVSHAL